MHYIKKDERRIEFHKKKEIGKIKGEFGIACELERLSDFKRCVIIDKCLAELFVV